MGTQPTRPRNSGLPGCLAITLPHGTESRNDMCVTDLAPCGPVGENLGSRTPKQTLNAFATGNQDQGSGCLFHPMMTERPMLSQLSESWWFPLCKTIPMEPHLHEQEQQEQCPLVQIQSPLWCCCCFVPTPVHLVHPHPLCPCRFPCCLAPCI